MKTKTNIKAGTTASTKPVAFMTFQLKEVIITSVQ